jgi:ribosomal protein S18 acetylase RimI-like enzyme
LSRPEPGAGHPEGSLVVRRVSRPDDALLRELEASDFEAFGETGLRVYDLAVVAEVGMVLVASVGDKTVGGCQLVRMLDEPDLFFVVGLYMRPGWRGRRLGGKLLAAVAEEARRAGAAGLMLTVSPENERALRLYESVGFAEEGFLADFYGKGEHRRLLRWRFE